MARRGKKRRARHKPRGGGGKSKIPPMTFTQSRSEGMPIPSMFWNWQWPRDIRAHWENDRHLVVDVESEGSEIITPDADADSPGSEVTVVEEGTEEYHRLFPLHEEDPEPRTTGDVAILVVIGILFVGAVGAVLWLATFAKVSPQ